MSGSTDERNLKHKIGNGVALGTDLARMKLDGIEQMTDTHLAEGIWVFQGILHIQGWVVTDNY